MEQQEYVEAGRRFGSYLRRVREGRKLSLDAVEELSAGQVERVTKSHLSRIENGQATPSFTRLVTLSRIYGVPVTSLAERFEIDLRRQSSPEEVTKLPDVEVVAKAKALIMGGRYLEALAMFEIVLDRRGGSSPSVVEGPSTVEIRLYRVTCWLHLECLAIAKEECEEVLSLSDLPVQSRIIALESLVTCCIGLGRFAVALMVLERAEAVSEANDSDAPARQKADLAALRALIHLNTASPQQAAVAYRKAIESYEVARNPFEACRCRINLGSALIETGEIAAAKKVLDQSLKEAESAGFERLCALALGELSRANFRKGDFAAAESYALRSNSIARSLEYLTLVFRNCFHLWKIARQRGDEASVKANERTLRAYVTRVDASSTEVREFRAFLTGDET